MPRKARIDLCGVASAQTYAPGALHHIIIRGNECKAIFKDNMDRLNFVERLDPIISETETGCLKGFRDIGIRIKGDERLLGSSGFVERVLKQAQEQLEEKYRLQASGISLSALIEKVANYSKIDPDNLKSASKERHITKARRVLCYINVLTANIFIS